MSRVCNGCCSSFPFPGEGQEKQEWEQRRRAETMYWFKSPTALFRHGEQLYNFGPAPARHGNPVWRCGLHSWKHPKRSPVPPLPKARSRHLHAAPGQRWYSTGDFSALSESSSWTAISPSPKRKLFPMSNLHFLG